MAILYNLGWMPPSNHRSHLQYVYIIPKSDIQLRTYMYIKNIYIQITGALTLAPETPGPKQSYLAHPETLFSESKGDPLWKHCSKNNGICINTNK